MDRDRTGTTIQSVLNNVDLPLSISYYRLLCKMQSGIIICMKKERAVIITAVCVDMATSCSAGLPAGGASHSHSLSLLDRALASRIDTLFQCIIIQCLKLMAFYVQNPMRQIHFHTAVHYSTNSSFRSSLVFSEGGGRTPSCLT